MSLAGNAEKVKEILRGHPAIDVNWRDEKDSSFGAIHRACLGGHDAIVSILLAHPDINVNLKNDSGYTPFMSACYNGSTSCVRPLLWDSRVKVTEADSTGDVPLRWIAHHGHLDTIRWWIALGREMDLGGPGAREAGVVAEARKRGKTEVVTLLERFKENPEKTRQTLRNELEIIGMSIHLWIFFFFL